jgi:HK97 family phage portal protein
VALFKTQIETGNYAAGYGNNWFRDGARPSGHFKYANGPIDPKDAAEIKARFKAAVSNNDFFVSGSDWSWETLSVAPAEAEFLQTIKATANQIAAIFRVNPEDIGGEAGSSLTYETLELNQINFQTRTLQPIFTRFEHHINRTFPGAQYIKFNPDAIVRTDLRTRMEAHKIGLEIGLETHAEGRALEDKAPLTASEKKAWMEYLAAIKPKPEPKAEPAGKIPSEGGA